MLSLTERMETGPNIVKSKTRLVSDSFRYFTVLYHVKIVFLITCPKNMDPREVHIPPIYVSKDSPCSCDHFDINLTSLTPPGHELRTFG